MGKSRKSGGGTGGQPQPNGEETEKITWLNAGDDPEKLAQISNMDFQRTEGGAYVFTDKETGLELHINSGVVENHGNSGYINTIVKIVSELPEMNKKSTPNIFILQDDYTRTYGQHTIVRNRTTKEYLGHGIAIATSAFTEGDVELKRIIYHETHHGYDYMRGSKTDISGISNTKAFKDALKKDGPSSEYGDDQKYKRNKYGQVTGVYSENSLYRKGSNYLLENYAEAGSIVQLKMDGNGTHKIKMPNGESTTVDQWCDNHPNLYKVVSNEIKNYNLNDFNKENVSHPMIDIEYDS